MLLVCILFLVCKDEGINELAEFCGGGKAVVEWTARVMEALATGLDLFKPLLARIQDFLEKMPSSKDQSSVLGSPSMVVAVNGTSECDVTDYWCPILHMVAAVDVTSECDIGVHVGGSLDTTTQLEAIAYTTYSHSGRAILLMTGAPERTTGSGRHLDESHRLQRVSSNGSEYKFLGNCKHVCRHCGALIWYEERVKAVSTQTRPQYHRYFSGGQVTLPTRQQYLDYIKWLFSNEHFMENIKVYNQMYHTSVGEGLIEFLDNHNALVRLFRTARDKLKDVDVPKFKV
ncbi:DNA helicase [Tanacetum coccineum]